MLNAHLAGGAVTLVVTVVLAIRRLRRSERVPVLLFVTAATMGSGWLLKGLGGPGGGGVLADLGRIGFGLTLLWMEGGSGDSVSRTTPDDGSGQAAAMSPMQERVGAGPLAIGLRRMALFAAITLLLGLSVGLLDDFVPFGAGRVLGTIASALGIFLIIWFGARHYGDQW